MFILFGTRGLTLTQQSGTFQCPQCGAGAPFSQKGIRRFFTLFFVPVIPLNQVAAYVECHRCKSQFDVNVLQPNLNRSTMQPGMPSHMPPLPGQGMPYANATITQRSNGMATTALVMGIVSLVTSFLLCPTFLLVPLTLLFGLIGLVQAGKTQTGKGKALAGIVCALLAVVVAGIVMKKANDSQKNAPPPTALESAKRSIAGRPEIRGYGNNAEAIAMAESLAGKMKLIHDTMIESSNGKKTSDQYAVHCELHEKTCAFLIFVPDYRKFEDELKDDMNGIAWTMATGVVQNSGKLTAADAELCVGLKGLVMFGSVMTGSPQEKEPKKTSADEKELIRFFPEPTPPASTGADAVKPPVVEEP
jgi:hypothetical protein